MVSRPRRRGGGQPGPRSREPATTPASAAEATPDPTDVWAACAGTDLPSNHAAQITRLVDDLLAGRPHQTTLASTRGTMEFVTALYASALLGTDRPPRPNLMPGHRFYRRPRRRAARRRDHRPDGT